MVNFADLTPTEAQHAHDVVQWAFDRWPDVWHSHMDLLMDLAAVHHTCPLDFGRMAGAIGTANLAHDVLGIARHLDRRTGKLGDCFVPRFAKLEG